MKQALSITLIFISLIFVYIFGYKSVIPDELEQSYMANKRITSWQPSNDSKLSSLIRVSPEFTLGFDIPNSTIGAGKQVAAPHNFFKLSIPNQFGFELSRSQTTEFTLKINSFTKVFLQASHPDFYINNQRPQSTKTEWSFTSGEIAISADWRPVKGSLTVMSGSYDYLGYEGHEVKPISVAAWSDKYTGFKGLKGQTILLESATQDSSFNLLVYNVEPTNGILRDVEIKTRWYTFWKFTRSGELVIGALDTPLKINILALD